LGEREISPVNHHKSSLGIDAAVPARGAEPGAAIATVGAPSGALDLPIAIIGAGFAGIGTAIRLKQAGIESFTMFERAHEVGGTWRDNTYPGAACDVPSHAYSLSFEQNPHWSRRFMVWSSGCNSWYLSKDGSNHSLFPGLAAEYVARARRFKPADYEIAAF
jgi:NAD(P)-binding Rossmann-like domain